MCGRKACIWECKRLLQFVNSRLNPPDDIGVLKKDNILISDDIQKAEEIATTFGEAYTPDNGEVPPLTPRTSVSIQNIEFMPYIVESELKTLSSRCTTIALPLSIIFNKSITSGTMPNDWKRAVVKPLYKKGSRTNPSNYHPISLTSTISKTIERRIRRHITGHLGHNKLLSDCQYVFRSKRSTDAQLLEFYGQLLCNAALRKPSFAVYIDFKKAFDKVSIPKLVAKLRSYGIIGNLLVWLESFLSTRTQFNKLAMAESDQIGLARELYCVFIDYHFERIFIIRRPGCNKSMVFL
uniref:Reverse transcriptase domain-containing protein n=1 Tax=Caenorhabditis japonica TaxID=281687 RepID=A0A8R1I4B9_CAEJA